MFRRQFEGGTCSFFANCFGSCASAVVRPVWHKRFRFSMMCMFFLSEKGDIKFTSRIKSERSKHVFLSRSRGRSCHSAGGAA